MAERGEVVVLNRVDHLVNDRLPLMGAEILGRHAMLLGHDPQNPFECIEPGVIARERTLDVAHVLVPGQEAEQLVEPRPLPEDRVL